MIDLIVTAALSHEPWPRESNEYHNTIRQLRQYGMTISYYSHPDGFSLPLAHRYIFALYSRPDVVSWKKPEGQADEDIIVSGTFQACCWKALDIIRQRNPTYEVTHHDTIV